MKIYSDFDKEQKFAIAYACQSTEKAIEVLDLLEDKDFSNPIYQTIFGAIQSAVETFKEVSPITVSEFLSEEIATNYHIDNWIKELKENNNDSITAICRALRDSRIRRYIYTLSEKIKAQSESSDHSGVEIVNYLERNVEILKNRAKIASVAYTTPNDVVDDAIEVLKKLANRDDKNYCISTGIKGLDIGLDRGGYAEGELTAIAGIRSLGKTALSLQGFYECGMNEIPACYITLEMTTEKLFYRMSLRKTNGQRLTKESARDPLYQEQIGEFSKWFKSKNLFVENRLRDVKEIIVYCKMMKAKHGIRAVFIDYGNLLEDKEEAKEMRYLQLQRTYGKLKHRIAMELGVAVVVNHQLSQKGEIATYVPTLGDFKESGGVADELDTAIFLYGDRAELDITTRIAKQRNYEIGKPFKVRFDRPRQIMQNGLCLTLNTEQETAF